MVALLASGALSFLTLRGYEDFASGVDWDYAVFVKGNAPQLTTPQFVDGVQDIADANGVTVLHLVIDRKNPAGSATLFRSAGGTRSIDWVRQGRYPAFSRTTDVAVRPLSELGGGDRAGNWFVWGSPQDATAVKTGFEALGVEPTVVSLDRQRAVLTSAVDVPTVSFLAMMVFLVAALAVAGVFLSARTIAVLDLHGRGLGATLVADALAAGRTLLVSSAVYLLGAGLVMWWYNGLAWFSTYLSTQLLFLVPFLAGAALLHALSLVVVRTMGILRRVKGEERSRSVHALMYAARVTALVLAVTSLALALGQENLVASKVRDAGTWESTRGDVQLSLGLAESEDKQREANRALGAWLDDQDRAGRLILAGRAPLQIFSTTFGLPAQTEYLQVNTTYLRQRPVRDASGTPVEPTSPREVIVMVPDDNALDEEALVTRISQDVDFELGLQHKENPAADNTPRPVRVVHLPRGQKLFAYLNSVSFDQDPFVRDPVVVAWPSAAPVFSDEQWAAAMSTGEVVLPDKDAVLASLTRANALRYVASVDEVEVTNAQQAKKVVVTARLYRLTTIAALLAIVATAVGFAAVHTRRNAAAIFAQHIHGWSFLARHHRLITVDATVAVAFAAWWTVRSQSVNIDDYVTTQPPPPLWTAWVIVIPALVFLWWVTATLSRRLISHRAAQ